MSVNLNFKTWRYILLFFIIGGIYGLTPILVSELYRHYGNSVDFSKSTNPQKWHLTGGNNTGGTILLITTTFVLPSLMTHFIIVAFLSMTFREYSTSSFVTTWGSTIALGLNFILWGSISCLASILFKCVRRILTQG